MIRIISILLLVLQVPSCLAQAKKDSILEVVSDHLPRVFYSNNKLCNGYAICYYPNGRVKMDGTFTKGKGIGVIRNYFEDGGIEDERHFKKGKLLKVYSFLPSGLLKRELDWKINLATLYYYNSANEPIKKIITPLTNNSKREIASETYLRKEGKWIKE